MPCKEQQPGHCRKRELEAGREQIVGVEKQYKVESECQRVETQSVSL